MLEFQQGLWGTQYMRKSQSAPHLSTACSLMWTECILFSLCALNMGNLCIRNIGQKSISWGEKWRRKVLLLQKPALEHKHIFTIVLQLHFLPWSGGFCQIQSSESRNWYNFIGTGIGRGSSIDRLLRNTELTMSYLMSSTQ